MENSSFNSEQEKLFDLIDQKNFEQLTDSEKNFVLSFMSQSEYENRRSIISQSKSAFADDVIPLAAPLAIQPTISHAKYKRTINLYRAMLAAAALIILFLLVVPTITNNPTIKNDEVIVQHDTVTIEKEIFDTVVIEKTVPQIVKEKIYVQAPTYETCSPEELRLLETGPVRPVSIDAVLTENNGKSITKDETIFLVKDLNMVSDVIRR